MKFTTTTGKELDLKRPTIEDRIRCNDITEVIVSDGKATIRRSFAALVEWCKAGLGQEFDFNTLNDNEIAEIAERVKTLASLGE